MRDPEVEEEIIKYGRELLEVKGLHVSGGEIDFDSGCIKYNETNLKLCILMEYLEIPNIFGIGTDTPLQP